MGERQSIRCYVARRWWCGCAADRGGNQVKLSARPSRGETTDGDRPRLCAAGQADGVSGVVMKRDVMGLRASPELRALIEGYGTLSTAAQALMLIGAAEMGEDLSFVRDDLVRLLWAGELTPELRDRIRKMLNTPLTERLTF